MTLSQTIIWTALPNGHAPGHPGTLRLSIFVSPRLMTDAVPPPTLPLSDFPDFLDWPATKIKWKVTIGGHTPTPVTITSPAPRSDLWKALFHATTEVKPYQSQSLSNNTFHSYPAWWVRDFHVKTYAMLAATSPTEWPSLNTLGLGPNGGNGPYHPLPFNFDEEQRAVELIGAALKAGVQGPFGGRPIHVMAPSATPDPLTDLEQAKLFLQPLTVPPKGQTWPLPPAEQAHKPDIDFHRMVSMLGEYPYLLRLFGLVYDLEVPLPAGLPPTFQVSVTPQWTPKFTPGGTTNVEPLTGATNATFLAEPRATSPEIFEGLLRLSDKAAGGQPAFPIIELELDGSTLKSLNFAQGVWRATTSMASFDTPQDYAPPALRSAGLALAHTGQALLFGQTMMNTDSLNSAVATSSPVPLFAEDVTRGFRIDVLDDHTNKWHQLCARRAAPHPAPGGYAIGKAPHLEVVPVPAGDEGWVALSVGSGPQGGANDTYLSETVLRWAGWSLVAPRPGKHLARDPKDGLESDASNPPTGTFPLQVAYAPTKGTLPPLRFGRTYRFRARAVDLAGNSLPFNPAPTAFSLHWASPRLRYGRLEPVVSPPLIPHDKKTPGEHLERIVIRSEFYNTPDGTVAPSERHIVPPSTTEEMAEAHGVLDGPGGGPDKSKYAVIAPLAGLTYATPSVLSSLGGKLDPESHDQPYYPVSELEVPYLPDVLARGAVLRGLPGEPPAGLLKVSFSDGPWPKARTFRLVVEGGTGAPEMPSAANKFALTVKAPKATFQTVRLSCYVDPGDLNSMGLWEWLEEQGMATPALKSLVISGQHFMFTPFREFVVVHAVRQPLTRPEFEKPHITRSLGKTFAYLNDTVKVDWKSSNKLDILSKWDEPFDDGVNPAGSVVLHKTAPVGELPLGVESPPPTAITIPAPGLRHDFGDTKYRLVYYEAQATTRFLEYFAETSAVKLHGTAPTTVHAGGLATGATVVTSSGTPAITYQPAVDYTEDDAHGTIAAVKGGAISPSGVGTATVEVRFVPPPVTRSSLEPPIPPPGTPTGYPLKVKSTARPESPDVRYVLPLFDFITKSTPTKVQSARLGNAVRVYLERPWWSSGDDELLGVVVYPVPPGTVGYPTGLEPLVTRYGRDPLRLTNPVKSAPTAADFKSAVATGTGLVLLEAQNLGSPPLKVDVAGHEVGFDTTHQLWYADVVIDTSFPNPNKGPNLFSYWPFVRLALVRYQPNSLVGVECSRVVQSDFVQLAPDRLATLTFGPAPTQIKIVISGYDYRSGPSNYPVGPSVMAAFVEEELPGVTDPDLMWSTVPGSEVLLKVASTDPELWTWTGSVTLPAPRGTKHFRIRLEENELWFGPQLTSTFVPTPRVTYIDTLQV